jgi:predicted ATPase/class 3 adenylate cyclase
VESVQRMLPGTPRPASPDRLWAGYPRRARLKRRAQSLRVSRRAVGSAPTGLSHRPFGHNRHIRPRRPLAVSRQLAYFWSFIHSVVSVHWFRSTGIGGVRMAELPSGTVTFLLTDIEGSTALWERLPEAMRLTVARHDVLLTEQIEQHGGVVIRSQGEGDSFFAVFPRASDAVAAARHIQQALRVEAWPTRTPLRVRIALHTGEAELRDGDYYGTAVNRCARLRAVAHGGQVLLSRPTYDLVRDAPPERVDLLDLGEYQLKDLLRPERVFQIADPDLPSAFPPLRTLEAHANNLPVQTTTLIGREREVVEITHQLLHDNVRLLTLTGPGGIGKTRLAVEVAQRLAERGLLSVAFAELAPIADPTLVPHAIAGAVGVRERVDRPLLETVADMLRSARLLLVLDNCEHLVAGCGAAAQALRRACPELRILATSRAPLGVSGEVTWSVPLLTVSADEALEPGAPEHGEAVQLFVERARLRLPRFRLNAENAEAVVEICRHLDGLPLAIELAAARIQLLPPAAILSRLGRRLALLVGGPQDLPTRQQTMRAAITWSYDLLKDTERAVFRQLGIFAGGFSLEAAEAVCTSGTGDGCSSSDGRDTAVSIPASHLLDLLESLLAKNLLRQEQTVDEPRFTILETIREYAREQLEASGELNVIRDRCAAFFLALAEEAAHKLLGREQLEWLGRVDTELDQLRALFGWSRNGEIASEVGLRLAGALVMYWEFRGLTIEGYDWVTAMLAIPEASTRTVAKARALYSAAFLTAMRGDFAAQRSLAQESATIFKEAGNLQEAGRSLTEQAVAELRLGDSVVARALLERSVAIAREHGDQWGLAFALGQLGAVAYQEPDFAAAREFRAEAALVARAIRDRHTLGLALAGLGLVARVQGNHDESAKLFNETLLVSSEIGDQWIMPRALGGLAGAGVLAADYDRAARLFGIMAAMRAVSGIGETAGSFRIVYERDESEARTVLGDEVFAAAWAEGREMTPEQAIAYALEKGVR